MSKKSPEAMTAVIGPGPRTARWETSGAAFGSCIVVNTTDTSCATSPDTAPAIRVCTPSVVMAGVPLVRTSTDA